MEGYSVALSYNIDLKLKHNSGLTVKEGKSLIVVVSYFSTIKIYENLKFILESIVTRKIESQTKTSLITHLEKHLGSFYEALSHLTLISLITQT